jgi:WD40 repeat protein
MSPVQIQKVHTLSGHNDCIYALAKGEGAASFFSGSGDGMVALWDLNAPDTGQLIAKLPNSVYALHRHVQTNLLVAGHNYEGIHLLDWQNKKEHGSLKLSKAAVFDIQSRDSHLFVGTGEGMVYKIDINSLAIQAKVHAGEKSARVIALPQSATGEVAIGFSDNMIRIFDEDLHLKSEWMAHENSVFALRYTADGRFLLSGSRDARLKVWDVRNGYALHTEIVAHMFAINDLDFSPDKKHFVTCSLDKTIKVWDAEEFRLLKVIDRARHGGHRTSVNKVLWTSHQDQLVSASDDRTIAVWHIIF